MRHGRKLILSIEQHFCQLLAVTTEKSGLSALTAVPRSPKVPETFLERLGTNDFLSLNEFLQLHSGKSWGTGDASATDAKSILATATTNHSHTSICHLAATSLS
jgi:hypothetical protein